MTSSFYPRCHGSFTIPCEVCPLIVPISQTMQLRLLRQKSNPNLLQTPVHPQPLRHNGFTPEISVISIPFSVIKHKGSPRNAAQEPNMLSFRCVLLPALNTAPTFDGEPMECEALDHLIFHHRKDLKVMELFFLIYG